MITLGLAGCLAMQADAQCDQQTTENMPLRILSWNIYMLPHLVLHLGQRQRAAQIVESLRHEDIDVIVFEEAFDKKSRTIIREGLKQYFPYESGDPARSGPLKGNSGLWVLSRTPVTVVRQIFFRDAMGADRFASKGAILIETKKGNYCFQVVATHLQSDLKGKDVKGIREKQYRQIQEELLEPCSQKNVPQFVVGDMNTMSHDSMHYEKMINTLEVKPCALEGELSYSYDNTRNDIINNPDEKPQLIDYVLFRSMGTTILESKMFVKIFRKKWHSLHRDLSDHFAVMGTFILPVKLF